MKIIQSVLVLIIILAAGSGYTQSIQGKITDATDSAPVTGAVVKVQGTGMGALSDLDGTYRIDELNPGIYNLEVSYIGFNSKLIKGVKVLSGEVTKINISLTIDGLTTEEISVESNAALSNEQSVLSEQKNSSRIQDGISEQQIKRAPDAAASDVLKRVTGVNISDNKFVFIRGTSERYSNTTLNGVQLPSTESDRKSFSFDLFPSKLLENIIIAKSFSPDLPGNFSGGLVQLNTKDFADQFTFNFETTGSFLSGTTSEGKFYTYNAGQNKIWFFNSGFDDGGRNIPAEFPSDKFSGTNEYGKSLKNNWAQNEIKTPLNGGFQISSGNNFSLFKNLLGVFFAYTYKNSFKNETVQRNEYNSDTTSLVNFKGRSSNYTVLNGGVLNLNYKIGENNKISFKNTMSVNSDDKTQYFEGFTRVVADFDRKIYATDFTERKLIASQISGSHYMNKISGLNLTWNASYSESEKNEPDSKTAYYQRELGSEDPYFMPLSSIANANVGQRFYSELFDISRGAGVNFDMNFLKTGKTRRSKIKFGGLATGTDRNFKARLFAPVNAGSYLTGYEPIEKIFSPENMNSSKIYYVETTDKSDKYSATENLYAGYLMFDIPLKKLRIITGLRYEYNEQKLNGFERGSGDTVNVSQRCNDYLPSLNITYALSEKSNLRGSVSQTVSRPELREIAPFGFIDFITEGQLSGNPGLEESLIQNYDLRYEIFPDAGEIASMSLFYKHFDQPIEKVIVPTLTAAIPSYTFDNAKNGAENYGVEFELRKKLGFISKYLKDFSLNANLTLVNSKVDLEGLQTAVSESSRRLQGQSPYTVNLGLLYDNYGLGLSANLLYNRSGDKISEAGKSGFSDVMENGRDILDFSVSKTFLENFEVKFNAKDLFDQDVIFTQKFNLNGSDIIKEVRRISSGTDYSLSLSYKF